jgi:hypothetical protein
MTITFGNDNNVIVYALETIISYARHNQYIFLAQSVWWISSIIGLQQGLVNDIDTLKAREDIDKPKLRSDPVSPGIHPDRIANFRNSENSLCTSEGDSISTTETEIHSEVVDSYERFLEQLKQEGKTIGGKTRQVSRVVKQKADKKANRKKPLKTFGTQTEGIDGSELKRRKAAGGASVALGQETEEEAIRLSTTSVGKERRKELHLSQRIQDTIRIRI